MCLLGQADAVRGQAQPPGSVGEPMQVIGFEWRLGECRAQRVVGHVVPVLAVRDPRLFEKALLLRVCRPHGLTVSAAVELDHDDSAPG